MAVTDPSESVRYHERTATRARLLQPVHHAAYHAAWATVALAVGLGCAHAQVPPKPKLDACAASFPGGRAPESTRPQLQTRATQVCEPTWAALTSGITRGPIWVATKVEGGLTAPRTEAVEFHTETSILPADRATPEDFQGSVFYHGRLAPIFASTPADEAVSRSSLATVVAMAPALAKGLWPAIDAAVRSMASSDGTLWVVAGPAFHGKSVESIGSGVLVPTAVWKAVYDPAKHGTAVYVCTNRNPTQCVVIGVSDLVKETGVDPFPGVAAAEKAAPMAMPQPEASPYKSE